MAKELSYVCTECSGLFSKWMGQCSECGAWNSIEKQAAVFQKQKSSSFAISGTTNEIQGINDVACETHERIKTRHDQQYLCLRRHLLAATNRHSHGHTTRTSVGNHLLRHFRG